MSRTDRHRSAAWVDRLLVLGVVALVGVAMYAMFDDSADAPPDVAPALGRATEVIVEEPVAQTSTSTSTVPTTTTLAPTTTMAATAEVTSKVCDSLRSDGLETRRVMVGALAEAYVDAGGTGDGRAALAKECGDALDRLDGAVEIRDRMQTIDMVEEDGLFALTLTDLSCGGGTFEVTVTNDTSTPLGLHGDFAVGGIGGPDVAAGSMAPIVIWSLQPGASEQVTGRFANLPEDPSSCDFEGQIFDADASSADASLGDAASSGPEYPAMTADDPADWFPALREVERAARSSGDIDLVAVTEDVRSMSYDEVAFAISEHVALPDSEILEVCERGRSQPDADHIGFVVHERLESGETRLLHAIFRRGADGQWRSLSTPRAVGSRTADDCSDVDPS